MPWSLDLDVLRAFVAIAETRSFSKAAMRLARSQSTVSQQIKRLEDALGHRVLTRTPRAVDLTPRGEMALDYAHRLLDLNDELLVRVGEPPVSGVVRLGTPEDFATRHLPEVLGRFAQAHPDVALEVTCDLTLHLLDGLRANRFDLALIKREPSTRTATGGVRVWREPLIWVSGPLAFENMVGPLPLVVSPEPCVYRKRAVEALTEAGRTWRIAYICGSLAGTMAAVRAGLGVAILPKDMVPPGLRIHDGDPLPVLADTEIALLTQPVLSAPALLLRDHVVRSLEAAGTPWELAAQP